MPAHSKILRQSILEARPVSITSEQRPRQPNGPTDRFPAPNRSLASSIRKKLQDVGLRPTRTRVALGSLLFAKGFRHVTAEMLFAEAKQAAVAVSLATVYNTLHHFTESGLLTQVAIGSSKSYFDTNNHDHDHFYSEDSHELIDIAATELVIVATPVPPRDYEISRIDVLVRLRRK